MAIVDTTPRPRNEREEIMRRIDDLMNDLVELSHQDEHITIRYNVNISIDYFGSQWSAKYWHTSNV